VLGIIPAAGAATRIQPLAFSKELLPVGSRTDEDEVERPKAVSEFIVERMICAGADRVCFVISPEKTDIIQYYARHREARRFCYIVQERPTGLCDAIFRGIPLAHDNEDVVFGLPDTVWFPVTGLAVLPPGELSFLLFPVEQPEWFDAVVTEDGLVTEIQVKSSRPRTHWVWGAFRMPTHIYRDLHQLWCEPDRGDEYMGTLVNEYLRRGGRALGVQEGERYYDIGTLDGYRAAVATLADQRSGQPRAESSGRSARPGRSSLPASAAVSPRGHEKS
jgi:dTDP-glucose pyrophosphorylase